MEQVVTTCSVKNGEVDAGMFVVTSSSEDGGLRPSSVYVARGKVRH